MTAMRRAFNLLELMVAVAIIALLAALTPTALKSIDIYKKRTGCLANMRQVGIGFHFYTAEHDFNLPARITGNQDRWPRLIFDYVGSTKYYVAPGDDQARNKSQDQLLSNSRNYTSFFMNGFDDAGAFYDPNVTINMTLISNPSNTLLLAQKKSSRGDFYMDLIEPPHGNQNDALVKDIYNGGANYVFVDGSARYIKAQDYDDRMWLVNPDFQIPNLK